MDFRLRRRSVRSEFFRFADRQLQDLAQDAQIRIPGTDAAAFPEIDAGLADAGEVRELRDGEAALDAGVVKASVQFRGWRHRFNSLFDTVVRIFIEAAFGNWFDFGDRVGWTEHASDGGDRVALPPTSPLALVCFAAQAPRRAFGKDEERARGAKWENFFGFFSKKNSLLACFPAGPAGGFVGHGGAETGVGGGVQQGGDGLPCEVGGDAGVGGEEVGEGAVLGDGGLGGVIDHVVRVLAADRGPRSSITASAMISPSPRSRLARIRSGIEPQAADDFDQAAEHVAGGDAGALPPNPSSGWWCGRPRVRSSSPPAPAAPWPRISAAAAMMSWQSFGLRSAAWWNCRRCRRNGFLDLAEFGLHQGVDFARRSCRRSRRAGRAADVLRQMVAERARGHRHGAKTELPADPRLHRRPVLAQRGEGPCAAAQHRDEQARARPGRRRSTVAEQFVDPDARPYSRRWPAPRAGHGCARRSAYRRRGRRGRPSPPGSRRSGRRKIACA